MRQSESDRRQFLRMTAFAGSAILLGASVAGTTSNGQNTTDTDAAKKSGPGTKEEEVTPLEDLMREHGVLRRVLFVFSEAAGILANNPLAIWGDAVHQAAKLFRTFGEDYHEKKLEEQYIFPLIRKKGAAGPAGTYPDILTAQHNRGREITDYIISATTIGKINANSVELSKALNGFVRMYRAHAAREDTIVFPAWKDLITSEEYEILGEKFEDIEHAQFGEDGYEDAVKQIAAIEASIGLSDISKFTAQIPPKVK